MLVFGSNSASTGYNLTRSLRFRSSATAYLNRTPAGSGNRTTWTYSVWAKLGAAVGTSNYNILMARTSASYYTGIYFNANNLYLDWNNSTQIALVRSSQVFRDPSAWYHIVIAVNTTSATSSNRILMYVNGTQVTAFTTATYPPQNAQTAGINEAGIATWISSDPAYPAQGYYDGYLAEVNFIDGQALTPSSFGSTNALTGVWQPARYTGTYGTNGFYLPFTDNSALTTSSNVGLGKDFSGNGNYWTTNNISITAGVTYDSMTDVPTLTSATAANFAVLNAVTPSTYRTLTNGNLRATGNTATNSGMSVATIGVSSGKIVWEETINTVSGNFPGVGATTVIPSDGNGQNPAASNTLGIYYRANGTLYINSNSLVGTFATFSAADVIRFELDATSLTCAVYKNNTLITTATGLTAGTFYPSNVQYNGSISDINFGQQPFANTPNTGFVALNTYNLPTSTIVKGNTVMDATLYTGTLLSNAITNAAAFKPDLVWIKSRSAATSHKLTDSVRGVTKSLMSNTSDNELTNAQGLTAFNTNGFTVGTDTNYNNLAATYVAWQWQAGQGSSSSNTNGSITSTVSVNASAGFSVVTWTGTGANATVGHGLGVAPQLIINKPRGVSDNWVSWHTSLGALGYIYLNLTNASVSLAAMWNSTLPTSSVFSVGTSSNINTSAQTMVSYCWTPIAGFSAFGSYSGNNSTDGPMVYTGFQPKFVLIKGTGNASGWQLQDSARNTYNVVNAVLRPDLSAAESTGYGGVLDFLSNGFKLRTTDTNYNSSSYGPYIYMAFATNPFKNSLGF